MTKIIKYVSAIIKWILRKDTLSNLMFYIRLSKDIFTSDDAKNQSRNQSLLKKLDMAQKMVDTVQRILPNTETEKYATGINSSTNRKTWGDFSAMIVKDKHGVGKNGIDLGINTRIGKTPFSLSYDPRDGSAKGKFGPFTFGSK